MIQVPDRLIKFAVATVLAVAAVGQLPRFNRYVQIQTLKVLKESQASSWGKAWTPPEHRTK